MNEREYRDIMASLTNPFHNPTTLSGIAMKPREFKLETTKAKSTTDNGLNFASLKTISLVETAPIKKQELTRARPATPAQPTKKQRGLTELAIKAIDLAAMVLLTLIVGTGLLFWATVFHMAFH
ncbi:hypothetical protein [Aliiruegeria lutimaris]|uniref:Uncharacterized protein n=1 Tax=Aliiruegeria lutimaris TaxID=571298 RepID=A0A1G9LEG7_9RHOB|nr:hypothetical protein [Aliiruegeria lutimaris]SDL60274.1 hypothetical protein SAMN04488026_10974 [Aliiruegeria lutimaris]